MKKIKKYFVNPEDSAVLAMSVVDEPAVESDFIYLSKQQKVDKFVALESNEKHMIYGCALRPDFPIYRNDGDEEYYLEFSKDAVEKLARNFMVNGLQQNFTQAHKSDVEGITITESWIKVDMEKDKSVALGLDADLPVGTWLIGAYCNNADVWDKVKEGTYHGFSVEAIVDVNELQFEEQTPSETVTETIDNKLDKIWDVVNSMFPKEEPNEPIQEPQVEPTIEEPITEPTVEEKPSEEPIEVDEGVQEGEGTIVQKEEIGQEEFIPNTPNPLEELIKNLNDELKALKESNASLQEKISGLEKQPSVNPIKPNAKPNQGDTYTAWREQMRQML